MNTRLRDRKNGLEITISEAEEVLVNNLNVILEVTKPSVFIGSAHKITPDSEPFTTTLAYETGDSIEEVFNKIMNKLKEKENE